MKIDLGRGQSIEIYDEGRNVTVKSTNNGTVQTQHLGLDDAVAAHAALGEHIKILRKLS